MKSFIWMGIIAAVLLGALFWATGGSNIEPPFEVGKIHPLDYVKGNASSTVLIAEYSDFQCPACRNYYPMMRELAAGYGDRVAFVYRHFPLVGIHPNAEFAARAAEAAGKQGKFWEMHDLLFEKQAEWSDKSDIQPIFESYANLLGISVSQFQADFLSKEVKNIVRAERSHAIKAGLDATPTFFVNGKKIENPNSVEQFKAIIDGELKASN